MNRTWLGQEVGNAGSSVAPERQLHRGLPHPDGRGPDQLHLLLERRAAGTHGEQQCGLRGVPPAAVARFRRPDAGGRPNPGQPASWSGIGGNPCEQSQTSWQECNYGAEVRQGTQREGMTINPSTPRIQSSPRGCRAWRFPEMTVSEDSNGNTYCPATLSDLDASLSCPSAKLGRQPSARRAWPPSRQTRPAPSPRTRTGWLTSSGWTMTATTSTPTTRW